MSEAKVTLSPEQIRAIEDIVRFGDRAEVVPVKDGIKILYVRRKEYKPKQNNGK